MRSQMSQLSQVHVEYHSTTIDAQNVPHGITHSLTSLTSLVYYWCTDGTVLLVHKLYWVFAFYVLEPMDCLSQPPTDLLLDTHLAIPMVSDSNNQ